MSTIELLDRLQHEAFKNEEIRLRLLSAKNQPDPLQAFCKEAQELGYPIYAMEVICAGEEFHASMKRSTNGGGENSPKIDGEDDYFELFLATLERRQQEDTL